MGDRYEAVSKTPQFSFAFASVDDDSDHGTPYILKSQLCELPDRQDIPDYSVPPAGYYVAGRFIPSFAATDAFSRPNRDYYRELAASLSFYASHRRIRIRVTNNSDVVATDVTTVFTLANDHVLSLANTGDIPREPAKKWNMHSRIPIASNFHARPGAVELERHDSGFRLEFSFQSIQPGRSLWSTPFWISAKQSGSTCLEGTLFAANLSSPQEIRLEIASEVSIRQMSVENILELAESLDGDDDSDNEE